jgi:drug/metabolite transporter (DMT)-like permease
MRLFSRIMCSIIAIQLGVAALMPLFGLNFIASRPDLVEFVPDEDLLYLYVLRSACLSTMCFYMINFLRRRRPLSSVSPLLTLSIMQVIFGCAYMLVFDMSKLDFWIFLAVIAGLGVFFHQENERESKVIFKDSW